MYKISGYIAFWGLGIYMEVHGSLQTKHTHNDNDNKTEKLESDVGALNWASCRASAILYLSFNSLENATWKKLGSRSFEV